MGLFELGLDCGCTYAIYKKGVLVKLCKKHYLIFKHRAFIDLITSALNTEPDFEPEPVPEAILGDP